jgi:hypothetical protein
LDIALGDARCAGFSAEAQGGCPDNSTVLDVHFKDAYGAERLSKVAGWHSWRDAAKSSGAGLVHDTNIVAMHTGGDSPRRYSHSDAPYYILYGESVMK